MLRVQLAPGRRQYPTASQAPAAATTSEDTHSAVLHAIHEGVLDRVRSIAAAATGDASLLPQLLGACCTFALCASAAAAAVATAKATSESSSATSDDWLPAALQSGMMSPCCRLKGVCAAPFRCAPR